MPPRWFMWLLWVSGDNWSNWALFETRSENMLAQESSRLAPKADPVSELSTCDCISETETGEIFMWLTPMVIFWSGDVYPQ